MVASGAAVALAAVTAPAVAGGAPRDAWGLSVTVRGLRPDVTYGVHLHDAPCSASNPGGHYKHDPAGGHGAPSTAGWPELACADLG